MEDGPKRRAVVQRDAHRVEGHAQRGKRDHGGRNTDDETRVPE
jgi:hypothetical protein